MPDRHDIAPGAPLGPALLCVGADPEFASGLARRAGALLAGRRAVVLSVGHPAAQPHGAFDAVLDSLVDTHGELRAEARRVAGESAEGASAALRDAGWEAEARVVASAQRPWEVALGVADSIGAGVIVVGASDRPGARAGALGSEVRALAHQAHKPLLVLTDAEPAPDAACAYLAFDGSDTARRALDAAATLLARRPVVVATAWRSIRAAMPAALIGVPSGVAAKGADALDEESREGAAALASEGASLVTGWQTDSEAAEARGAVWEAIVDAAAARDAAVVVIGTRGRSRVAAAVLGSVAEGVVRHAQRPVLLVPPEDRRA